MKPNDTCDEIFMTKHAISLRLWAGGILLSVLMTGCQAPRGGAPSGNQYATATSWPSSISEAFDEGSAAWTPTATGEWRLVEGRLETVTRNDAATAALHPSTLVSNVFVEIEYIREPASVGAGGLAVRATTNFNPWAAGSGYMFALGSDGAVWHAAVFGQVEGAIKYLFPWTTLEGIGPGTNRLGVLARGSELQFYVNGALVWEGRDEALASGSLGVFATTSPDQEATHRFDQVQLRQAPAADLQKKKKSGDEPKNVATSGGSDRSPLLRPGLMVRISVLVSGRREIDADIRRVSDNHMLDLPLVGAIPVEGMTLQSLNELLEKRYREYFINPQVVADFVVEERADAMSPWGSVVVLGRVRTPGRVNIPPTQDLTLSAAIQGVGGFDTSARTSAIRVTRRKPDGKNERITIDFTAVGAYGELENDLILKPGDVIFVPERIF
jgi:polysaccharide export outer membrane protein